MSEERHVAAFRAEWKRLAEICECDDHDGAEYRRVLAAWLACHCPDWIEEFIRHGANII